jgi:two-component system nitrogen regulation sensor histidine kinase GlnL
VSEWRTGGVALLPQALLDSLRIAILIVDPLGHIEYVNASAQTLLAVGQKQAWGRPLSDILQDAAPLQALIDRARRETDAIAHRGLRIAPLMRMDSDFVTDCTATVIEHDRVLVEIADTTRQSRITRDAALLAQQGGSRLMVRALAHEIKNPLGGLRGAAQLLERELPDTQLREYTQLIVREADRLRKLVDDLLGPGGPQHKVSLNLHEIVEHVYRLLRSEAEEDVLIVRDYDPSLPPIEVDRDQMIQTMLNIGRNAVQVLGGAGRLVIRTRALVGSTIATRRHRLVASIQFEDDGPGVPPELADTIFYPLVTGRTSGSGLGLAVAQDLATRHGGLIEFDSRPGRTIFTLLLPFEELTHG